MLNSVSSEAPTREYYRNKFTFEQRKAESSKIREKYPNRTPIIVEKFKNANEDVPEIDKTKYLVPSDITVGQILYVIRKRIQLPAVKSLYIFTDKGTIPPTASLISSIAKDYADEDGFLYFTYNTNNTFGN